MSGVPLTPALRAEYEERFRTCRVRPEHKAEAEALAARIAGHRADYEAVAAALGIPWQFVGTVHCMETGLRFDRHLHNGDSLQRRTVHVPAGRPPQGDPPFTWDDSARDALLYQKLDRWSDWSLAGILYCLEDYNGWGYRKYHSDVPSPYLWSHSQHYASGKYVADGTWDSHAVSAQCGAAVLLLALAQRGDFDLMNLPRPVGADVHRPAIAYWNPGDPVSEAARKLQLLLNETVAAGLVPDGKPAAHTSDAVERLLGHRLVGDPRG